MDDDKKIDTKTWTPCGCSNGPDGHRVYLNQNGYKDVCEYCQLLVEVRWEKLKFLFDYEPNEFTRKMELMLDEFVCMVEKDFGGKFQ